jgi:hypothetical protein
MKQSLLLCFTLEIILKELPYLNHPMVSYTKDDEDNLRDGKVTVLEVKSEEPGYLNKVKAATPEQLVYQAANTARQAGDINKVYPSPRSCYPASVIAVACKNEKDCKDIDDVD